MYGSKNKFCHEVKAPAMMQLRGKKFDASKFIATGTAFSDFAVWLFVGAGLQSRRGALVRESLMHQDSMLRGKCGTLKMNNETRGLVNYAVKAKRSQVVVSRSL